MNGSALAWARIWAALVEQGRQADGSVVLPDVLSGYLGGRLRGPCSLSRPAAPTCGWLGPVEAVADAPDRS